jgi:O-antigen ligase
MGNYAEYQNPAHNMVLQLLQDGGIIELVLVGILWIRIFRRIWMVRREAWALVALTASMLASTIASAIFYPTLSTGWYLGLYFVAMHLMGSPSMSMEVSSENARNNRSFGKN